MSAIENVSRRGFLKGLASAGAFVLGAYYAPEILWGDTPRDTLNDGRTDADNATLHPNVFVGIETDGTVWIVAHRSEMGTVIRTSLPLVLADELDADWRRVKIDQAIRIRTVRIPSGVFLTCYDCPEPRPGSCSFEPRPSSGKFLPVNVRPTFMWWFILYPAAVWDMATLRRQPPSLRYRRRTKFN